MKEKNQIPPVYTRSKVLEKKNHIQLPPSVRNPKTSVENFEFLTEVEGGGVTQVR